MPDGRKRVSAMDCGDMPLRKRSKGNGARAGWGRVDEDGEGGEAAVALAAAGEDRHGRPSPAGDRLCHPGAMRVQLATSYIEGSRAPRRRGQLRIRRIGFGTQVFGNLVIGDRSGGPHRPPRGDPDIGRLRPPHRPDRRARGAHNGRIEAVAHPAVDRLLPPPSGRRSARSKGSICGHGAGAATPAGDAVAVRTRQSPTAAASR